MLPMTYAMAARGLNAKRTPPHKPPARPPVKPIIVATPSLEHIENMVRAARVNKTKIHSKTCGGDCDGSSLEDINASRLNSHDSKTTLFGTQKNTKKEVSDEESNFRLLESTGSASLGHTKRVSIDTVATTDTGSGSSISGSDHKSNSSNSSAPHIGNSDKLDDKKVDQPEWVERPDETFVNTEDKIREFLPNLLTLEKGKPQAMCDLEGNSLGKPPGTVSTFQLHLKNKKHTWVFDVTKLGKKVFYMMGTQGQSIRELLESKEYLTCWWDCRRDANALWFHFQIQLNPYGTIDIQLMELATRSGSHAHRAGLDSVVGPEGEKCGYFTREQARAWTEVKVKGKYHFKTNPLGYGVFDVRPLPPEAMKYAAQDTTHLHMLYEVYSNRMRYAQFSMEFVREQTKEAILLACSDNFVNSRLNALSPPGFCVDDDPYDSEF